MGAVTSRLAPHIISQAMDDVNRQVLQYLSIEVLQCLGYSVFLLFSGGGGGEGYFSTTVLEN